MFYYVSGYPKQEHEFTLTDIFSQMQIQENTLQTADRMELHYQ
jgi:hypothetical protein